MHSSPDPIPNFSGAARNVCEEITREAVLYSRTI